MNYVNRMDEMLDNESFINEQSFDDCYDNNNSYDNNNIMDVEEFEILDDMGLFEE